jgi:hypothetical protein
MVLGRSWRCTLRVMSKPGGDDGPSASNGGRGDGPDDLLLADGGSVCNLPLPLMLSLGVRRCLCVLNVGEPLPTAAQWDPFSGGGALPPPGIAFSEDLTGLFGVRSTEPNPSKDLTCCQCFGEGSLAPIVAALQAAQASGRGAVATTRLRTVANAAWQLEAGIDVVVTWVYISRCPVWEARLPRAVRARLPQVPSTVRSSSLLGDASRATPARFARALFADAGGAHRSPLDSFPQYPLTRLRLHAVEANALYQQCGWVLREHEDQLRELFSEQGPQNQKTREL